MTTQFEPLINRILEVATLAAGTDGRTIPAGAFRYDTHSTKEPSLVSQDAIVSPVFELEDLIPSNANAYSENATATIYDVEIRILVTYKVRSGVPDIDRKEIIARLRNDVHLVRRALGNPETLSTFQGTDTGLHSGCLDFVSASAIRWIQAEGIVSLASQTLSFTGKVTLDFA